MSCKGCDKKKNNYTVFDRYGNIVDKEDVIREVKTSEGEAAVDKSLSEILEDKKRYREGVEQQHELLIESSTDDMKRIMLMELISIYNHEEISMTRMSPTQALVALWKYIHHPRFQKVLKEFPGLAEEVDTKYNNLMKNKIKSGWFKK